MKKFVNAIIFLSKQTYPFTLINYYFIILYYKFKITRNIFYPSIHIHRRNIGVRRVKYHFEIHFEEEEKKKKRE